ncbi:MAG TPA: DUF4375 domain-containing protein [Bryobacteraceae bacterium]|nr:DUF4375 domain-containing protein [Bryobacteraceae bacterium]
MPEGGMDADEANRILAGEDRRDKVAALMSLGRILVAGRFEDTFYEAICGNLDDCLYWEIAALWGGLCDVVNGQNGLAGLSSAERNFYAALSFHYSWQNGGLWQYFHYLADHHQLTIEGLRAIGAPRHAQMLESAGSVFGPDGPPADRESRSAAIDALTDQQVQHIHDCNVPIPGAEHIDLLLFVYSVEHRAEFREYATDSVIADW